MLVVAAGSAVQQRDLGPQAAKNMPVHCRTKQDNRNNIPSSFAKMAMADKAGSDLLFSSHRSRCLLAKVVDSELFLLGRERNVDGAMGTLPANMFAAS